MLCSIFYPGNDRANNSFSQVGKTLWPIQLKHLVNLQQVTNAILEIQDLHLAENFVSSKSIFVGKGGYVYRD